MDTTSLVSWPSDLMDTVIIEPVGHAPEPEVSGWSDLRRAELVLPHVPALRNTWRAAVREEPHREHCVVIVAGEHPMAAGLLCVSPTTTAVVGGVVPVEVASALLVVSPRALEQAVSRRVAAAPPPGRFLIIAFAGERLTLLSAAQAPAPPLIPH